MTRQPEISSFRSPQVVLASETVSPISPAVSGSSTTRLCDLDVHFRFWGHRRSEIGSCGGRWVLEENLRL